MAENLSDKAKEAIRKTKEDRLVAEDKTTRQDIEHSPEGSMTGKEVIDEIEAFLAELKRKAQFAYPQSGSE